MSNFRKTVAASSIAAALVGLSGPANAIIEAMPGEALLVPLVLFDPGQPFIAPTPGSVDPGTGVITPADPGQPFVPQMNTLVQVTVPAVVGFDTIPAFFTAPNSTPTNAGALPFPEEPALGAEGAFSAGVHVFVFNEQSVEIDNFMLPTSPDDFIMINWGDRVVNNAPTLAGQKGYMIITNEKSDPAFYPNGWLSPAQFSMMGDAYLVWNPLANVGLPGVGLVDTKIPVLPMSDGANLPTDAPSTADNVIFDSDGTIVTASPLTSGMRTNLSDGDLSDFTLFDLTMSNRFAPTLHVIWVDENIGQSRTQFVYDDDEKQCSQPIPILNELQVYWTSPALLWPNTATTDAPDGGLFEDVTLPWVDLATELCYPDRGAIVINPGNPGQLFDLLESNILYPGFVRFRIDEYVDTGIGAPESAAVAFSIQLQVDILDEEGDLLFTPQLLPVETALGHERGSFEN
jgi:hypothetical protein